LLNLPPEFICFCLSKHIGPIARNAKQTFRGLIIACCLLRATLVLSVIIYDCCLESTGWF
jgi:hypothetical protein